MNPETERAIASTEKAIIDQITQGGTDFIFSNISEKCSFCDSDASGVISQIFPFKSWQMGMAFSVCDSCGTPEKSDTILTGFIKDLYSLNKLPTAEILSTSELRESALLTLTNDLQLSNVRDKDKDGGFEITGMRASGLSVIFRYRNMNDFAYIFMLNGAEKCRIDTAAHHLKTIDYGPDHIHKETEAIKATPTFGSPCADKYLLNTIISKIESEQNSA
jgi:hypothetical protein